MISYITGAVARRREELGDKQKGFTLIELLVVVLIIGVLAAVAIPIFLNQQEGAKDSAVAAQVTQAKTALAVELAKGKTVAQALVVASTDGAGAGTTASPGLDSFTRSSKIDIVISAGATATQFTITGAWDEAESSTGTVTYNKANHGYTTTEATSVTKATT